MATLKEQLLDFAKAYWLPISFGLVSIFLIFYANALSDERSELTQGIAELEELKKESTETVAELDKGYDKAQHVDVIKERTVSATNIAKELIAMDDTLTAFYQTNEPLPEDAKEREALFAELETAQLENARLTGAEASDHIDTWKLNPAWTTELETVVAYNDAPQVPILFSMKTADGENAGVVYGTYNAERNMFINIVKHYTNDGMLDAVDVGGI